MEPVAMTELLPGLLNWELFIQIFEILMSGGLALLIASVIGSIGWLLFREGKDPNVQSLVIR
ncbi:MAG: hypothetical protein IPL01_02415 [Acidobacteria bacterium]|nr:hypothetical protein [Acidobacteriota bacterium]